jgi:prolyl 4-hydroxylase
MLPGEMILYESHSIIHGRPYPLKGRFMANVFIHFEPTGHSLRHNLLNGGGDGLDVDQKYRQALEKGHGGHENEEQDRNGLPPYVILGSEEEGHWRMQHPSGSTNTRPKSFTTGSTQAHTAAQTGNLDALKDHVARDKKVVHAVDSNGWTPLHEVRALIFCVAPPLALAPW